MAKSIDVIITGSWDKSVKTWDLRSKSSVATLPQQDKVFSMDAYGHMLVVALAGRTMQVYDIRNTSETLQSREASLKHMIRQVMIQDTFRGHASLSTLYSTRKSLFL